MDVGGLGFGLIDDMATAYIERLAIGRLGLNLQALDRMHGKGIYRASAQSARRWICGQNRGRSDRGGRVSRGQLATVAKPWAEKVAERFAAGAVSTILKAGRRVFLGHLTGRLAATIDLGPIGDGSGGVNNALDAWEDQVRPTRPRVAAFNDDGGAEGAHPP